jgi:signal peptidase II
LNAGTKPAAVPVWRYVLFLSIAAGGCLVDLLTKHWIFQWLGMPGPGNNNVWWIWEGYLGIEPALNPGALFGMGAGHGNLFAILSIIFGVGILYAVFVGRADRDLLLTIALGCVLGGMLGNLYDRLGFWHPPGMPGEWRTEVRDWILLRYRSFTWPNFNIADSLLVCGVGLLLWHAFRSEREKVESKK